MQIVNLCWTGQGLAVTATSVVMQRLMKIIEKRQKRGGKRARKWRKRKSSINIALRVGTLNVGTMTRKGREIADLLERRKLDKVKGK